MKLGLKDTYLYKKVFMPPPAGIVMPADQKKFGLGKTTAREMAAVMTKIVNCELAEPGSPATDWRHRVVRRRAEDAACASFIGMRFPDIWMECLELRGFDCEQDRIARRRPK